MPNRQLTYWQKIGPVKSLSVHQLVHLLIWHDWMAEQVKKSNRRFFDSLRDAPVAQNDSLLVMQSFCAGLCCINRRDL
jgi:hypothetical protein